VKRRFAKLVVFLLLGAIVNVAVAWVALTSTSTTYRFYKGDDWIEVPATKTQISDLHDAFPNKVFTEGRYLATGSVRFGWAIHQVRFIPRGAVGGMITNDPVDYPSVTHVVNGLPLPALQYFATWTRTDKTQRGSLDFPKVLHKRDGQPDLPFWPIWPGFAINTLFYAGILWLLFTAPFALRRRRRIKRGLCPACAYPVCDSQLCTECGAPRVSLPRKTTLSPQPSPSTDHH
jgi:hypothetical protein